MEGSEGAWGEREKTGSILSRNRRLWQGKKRTTTMRGKGRGRNNPLRKDWEERRSARSNGAKKKASVLL